MSNRTSSRRSANLPTTQNRSSIPNIRTFSNKTPSALHFNGIHDDTLITLLGYLLGKDVTINAIDGSVYTGTFTGTERMSKEEISIVLRYATILKDGSKKGIAILRDIRGSTIGKLQIPLSRMQYLGSTKIDFASFSPGARVTDTSASAKGFAIDGEISRLNSAFGKPSKQLQRFNDFTEIPNTTNNNSSTLDEQTFGDLATPNGNRSRKWDQFQVNEDKFGIKTSFDEDEYTTKLDRHGAGFAEKQREAARLASEIEREASENVHIREERNQDLGGDFNEEDLYSGVQRPTPPNLPEPVKKNIAEPREKPRLSYAAAAAGKIKNTSTKSTADKAQSQQTTKPTTQSTAKKDNDHTNANEMQTKAGNSREKSGRDLSQLAKVRSAPTGRKSPKRDSPLVTSAPVNSSTVGVLNLDAQTAKPEHRKRFEEFKANRGRQSITDNREKITDDMKNFSSNFNSKISSKNSQNRRSQGTNNNNSPPPITSNNGPSTPRTTTDTTAVESKQQQSTSTGISSVSENKQNSETKEPESKKESNKAADVSKTPATSGVADKEVKDQPKDIAVKISKGDTASSIEETSEKVKDKKSDTSSNTNASKPKQKTKLKSKLNPNAQEFKLNPNAPSFEPAPKPSPAPQNKGSYPYSPGGGAARMEYSQPMQPIQGYPMPVQNMHVPYGQHYPMVISNAIPAPVANGSGFQYVQGGFPGQYPSHTTAVPLAPYQMNQVMLAQAQAQQRIPTHPFQFYASRVFPPGHAGASHLAPAPQPAAMYQPNTAPMPMQQQHVANNAMGMMARGGGHGNRRGRGRGRYHGQVTSTGNPNTGDDAKEESDRKNQDEQH